MEPEKYITYSQITGEIIFHGHGTEYLMGAGWSGHGAGKNNPKMQARKNIGPIPVGWYSLGDPFHHPRTGPFTIRLAPDANNEMFGRDGFLIHGPAMAKGRYGQESEGCIVAPRLLREDIVRDGIKTLQVIP